MGGRASGEILRAWQQLPASQARPLSEPQADQLAAFLEGMSRWNAVHNITAVGAEASVPRHILDALVAWPSLLEHLGDQPNPVILDVGSGNGVPGLPWAVVAPSLQVHLVERVARKAAFLRRAARDLGLSGRVRVFQESVESGSRLVAAAPPQGYAIIASRAFAAGHGRRILEALAVGPAGQSGIAERAGLTIAQVSKRLCDLRLAGAIERDG
ncbi:MAG: RsmG family class I SAM-dependent methyltransferase, partial [Burkholderiaceae bacterium]